MATERTLRTNVGRAFGKMLRVVTAPRDKKGIYYTVRYHVAIEYSRRPILLSTLLIPVALFLVVLSPSIYVSASLALDPPFPTVLQHTEIHLPKYPGPLATGKEKSRKTCHT